MIAIFCTLRGRPDNVKKFIEEYKAATGGNSELLFAVDSDDPCKDELLKNIEGYRHIEGTWPGVCQKLQSMYEAFKDDKFTVYHGSADDITYSKHFDTIIMNELSYLDVMAKHRCWILYGNDMVHGQRLCTHWFATKEYVDAVGYFTPKTYMNHCFTDNTFYFIAISIGILRYIPWLMTHHHSWANGEAKKDENFERAYAQDKVEHDRLACERWIKEESTRIGKSVLDSILSQIGKNGGVA